MRFLQETKQQKTAKQQSSSHTEPERPDDMSVCTFCDLRIQRSQTKKDILLMI